MCPMLSFVSSPKCCGLKTLYAWEGMAPFLQKLTKFFEFVRKLFLISTSLSDASMFGLMSMQLSVNRRSFFLLNMGLAGIGASKLLTFVLLMGIGVCDNCLPLLAKGGNIVDLDLGSNDSAFGWLSSASLSLMPLAPAVKL